MTISIIIEIKTFGLASKICRQINQNFEPFDIQGSNLHLRGWQENFQAELRFSRPKSNSFYIFKTKEYWAVF